MVREAFNSYVSLIFVTRVRDFLGIGSCFMRILSQTKIIRMLIRGLLQDFRQIKNDVILQKQYKKQHTCHHFSLSVHRESGPAFLKAHHFYFSQQF